MLFGLATGRLIDAIKVISKVECSSKTGYVAKFSVQILRAVYIELGSMTFCF